MRHALLALSVLLAIGTVAATEPEPRSGAAQRTLTLEDRVAAQRAVGQVGRHRMWPNGNPETETATPVVGPCTGATHVWKVRQ